MDSSRRDFLTGKGRISAGAPIVLAAAETGQKAAASSSPSPMPRWGMVIDIARCIGCQACTLACIMENRVPENNFRTFVSTYEVTQGQQTGLYMLPRLCNHCEAPPCVPVCPVKATFKMEAGPVVVDGDRCVGCGYCVQACPYDARFINPETRTADKCTFCLHRLEAGLLPACVETCVGGSRIFGDLNDPDSEVSLRLKANGVDAKVLKPEENTRPSVFYLGLDPHLSGRVEGTPTLWRPSAETV